MNDLISPEGGTLCFMPYKNEYGPIYIVKDGYVFISVKIGDKFLNHVKDVKPFHEFHFTGTNNLLNISFDDINFYSIDYLIARSLMYGLKKATAYNNLKEDLLKDYKRVKLGFSQSEWCDYCESHFDNCRCCYGGGCGHGCGGPERDENGLMVKNDQLILKDEKDTNE